MTVVLLPLLAATMAPGSCPGIEKHGSRPQDVDRFYADRAASILRLGLAMDLSGLEPLVSPDASFELWHGDYSTAGRVPGASGAVDIAREMAPKRYRLWTRNPGPVAAVPGDCTWAVELTIAGEAATYRVTFSFKDGLLVQAVGSEGDLVEAAIDR